MKADVSLEELERKLVEWGCEQTVSPPIPLGDDEQVIEVSGPPDLPSRVRSEDSIIKVSPNSPMTLY